MNSDDAEKVEKMIRNGQVFFVVLSAVFVTAWAVESVTPTGAYFGVDYDASKEAGLTGVLIVDVSKPKIFKDAAGSYYKPREFVAFDFEACRFLFLDAGFLNGQRKPIALSDDRRTVFFIERRFKKRDGAAPIGSVFGEYDVVNGAVCYFIEEPCEITGFAYSPRDASIFYSYVNYDRAPRRDGGLIIYKNNIKRIGITSGEIETVTGPDNDCRLLSIAPEARLMLVAERQGTIPWTDDITVYDYEGRRIAVLIRDAVRPAEGYTTIISSNGELIVAGGESIHFGSTHRDVVSGRNVYVIYKDGRVNNMTCDRVNWMDYCLSPGGKFLGLVVDGFVGGAVSSRPGFYVLEIETLKITRIITKPSNRWFIPISWNK